MMLLTPMMLGSQALAQDGARSGEFYRVVAGDRISVSVFGQSDLSGEHLIDGAGNIYLPLVGPVRVGELTLAEAEHRIRARLADGVLRHPFVTVRVTDLRPIYVVGDVKIPGSYPYRPGASVLSAIALAGGFGVKESEEGKAINDLLLSEQRLSTLEQSRRALLVRRARLEAQRSGARTFQFPDAGDGNAADKELLALISEERDTLDFQARTLDKEIEMLTRQKPRLQKEIDAVQAQIRSEQRQLDLIQARIDDHQRLLSKDLALRSTGLELEREKARNHGNVSKFGADVARLELTIGEIDIKIQDARNAYNRQVVNELQETRSKLLEIDSAIPAAREIRSVRLELFEQTAGTLPVGSLRQISIVRAQGKQATLLSAAEATLIEPGDVIQVVIPRREPRVPPSLYDVPKGRLRDVTAATTESVARPPK